MLRIDDRNTNYNGAILVGGNQVAYVSGSHNEDTASFSVSIENYDVFQQNLATVKTDVASFLDTLAEVVGD